MSSKAERNRIVRNAPPPKKKKSCCCRCFVTLLIVFVVILGAGAGVGWYFGDQYTRENFDMGLGDVLGVMRDVTSAKEKKIVTNSYANASKTAFENKLKAQLFLKDTANIDKAKIMEMLVGGNKSGESTEDKKSNSYNTNSYLTKVLTDDTAQVPESNELMDMLAQLLTPENMNLDTLKNYTEATHDNYLLQINDKELASFLNACLEMVLEDEAFLEPILGSLPVDISSDKLKEIIRIDQLTFGGSEAAPSIKVTVSVGLKMLAREAANGLIKDATGYDLAWATAILPLPKRLFLTAEVVLKDEPELNLFINNMDQAKMDRFYKLLKGVGKVTGSDIDIKKMVDDSVGETLKTVGTTLKEYANFSSISTGTIKLDVFDVAIKLMGTNEGKEGDEVLKSSDLILALKYLLTSDFEKAISEKYTWKDQYYTDNILETTYKPADITGYTLIDYQEELFNEICDKYLINREGRSFDDLMKLFGIGGDGTNTEDIMDWVDPSKLNELANRQDTKVLITDRMLGAMFNATLGSLMSGEGGSLDGMDLTLYQVAITVDDEGRQFMQAAIAVDLISLLGDGLGNMSMLEGIIPAKIMVGFTMEISVKGEDYEYAPTTLTLNDLTVAEVDRLLSIIEKIVPDFGFDGLTEQIEGPMRLGIKSMTEQIPGVLFQNSGILMADLFDMAVDLVINTGETKLPYKNDNGEDVPFTGADLKEIIKELFADVIIDENSAPSNNQHEFMQSVIDNYFLKKDIYLAQADPDKNVDDGKIYLDTFNDLSLAFNIDNLDGSKLDIDGLMSTKTPSEDLRPEISQGEMANLIIDMMDSDLFGESMKIKSFKIIVDEDGKESIEIAIEVSTKELFNDDSGDFNRFFSVDELYVFVTVDLSQTVEYKKDNIDSFAYATDIKINNMTKLQVNKMMAMVNHFNSDSSDSSLDLFENATEIGYYMYDKLGEFKSSLGDNCEFVNGGLKIASIFDLIASSQDDGAGNHADSEDVRAALQGLYAKSGANSSDYNYDANTFDANPVAESIGSGRIAEIASAFLPAPFGATNVPVLDKELGYLISGNAEGTAEGTALGAFFPKLDFAGSGFDMLSFNIYADGREYANDNNFSITGFDKDNTYIEFVFKISDWGGVQGNKFTSLLPEEIYITILFEMTQSGLAAAQVDGENYIRINKLSLDAQNTLFNIAKISNDEFGDQLDKCGDLFATNTLFNGPYGSTDNKLNGTLILNSTN